MTINALTKTIHSNRKKINSSNQDDLDNLSVNKDNKYYIDNNFDSEKNSTLRQTINQKTFITTKPQKSQDLFLTNAIIYGSEKIDKPKNENTVIEGLKGSTKQYHEQLFNLEFKKETTPNCPTEKNRISPERLISNPINLPSNKLNYQLKVDKTNKNPISSNKDYHKILTIKNRNTVLNNIHKVQNKNKESSKSRTRKDSLEIDSVDEIFDHLPEIELRNNLLDGKTFINTGNKFLDYVNIIQKPKFTQKRIRLFDRIYKIDDEFLDELDRLKKNKDKFELSNYQNRIFSLLSARMSKENLRKLSLQFKDVQELSDRVKSIDNVDWDDISKQIENILLCKKASNNSSIYGIGDKLMSSIETKNQSHIKRSSILKSLEQNNRSSVLESIESKKSSSLFDSLDHNKRLSILKGNEHNKSSFVVRSVEPNKKSSIISRYEDVTKKLNTVSNSESKIDLIKIEKNKKEYKRKITDGLKSRTVFLPSYLVEKLNKVIKIKN